MLKTARPTIYAAIAPEPAAAPKVIRLAAEKAIPPELWYAAAKHIIKTAAVKDMTPIYTIAKIKLLSHIQVMTAMSVKCLQTVLIIMMLVTKTGV